MATFTKLKLSGSTDGKAIKVAATATAGTTIHTAPILISMLPSGAVASPHSRVSFTADEDEL